MREKLIAKILGEGYKAHLDSCLKILDYVDEHPTWKDETVLEKLRGGLSDQATSKNLDALDEAVQQYYGRPLAFYLQKSRRNEIASRRAMIVRVFRYVTGTTYMRMQELFCRDHSTLSFRDAQLAEEIQYDMQKSREFDELKEIYKQKLCVK